MKGPRIGGAMPFSARREDRLGPRRNVSLIEPEAEHGISCFQITRILLPNARRSLYE